MMMWTGNAAKAGNTDIAAHEMAIKTCRHKYLASDWYLFSKVVEVRLGFFCHCNVF